MIGRDDKRAPIDQREHETARLDSPRIPGKQPTTPAFSGKSAYLVLFSQIGVTLLVATLGAALLGNWIDQQIGSRPLLLVVGFLGGFAAGSLGAARTVRRALQLIDADERERREGQLQQRVDEQREGSGK